MIRLGIFLLGLQCAFAQQIVATDLVTIKTLNTSNDQTFLGRTHRHLNELQIYDLDSLWGVNIVTENGGIKCFSFSPDDQRVAIGTYRGFVELWEIRTRRRLWVSDAHKNQVNDIKFTPDGRSLITGATDGKIFVSSFDDLEPDLEISTTSNINTIELVPGSDHLFVTGDHNGSITVWSRIDGKMINQWRAHDSYIFDLVFDGSGKTLFSSSHDRLVKKWDFAAAQLRTVFQAHTRAAYTIDLSDNGKLLVSGSMDNTVILWDVSSGEPLRQLAGHSDYVMVVRFVSDSVIFSGSRDFTLRRWMTSK